MHAQCACGEPVEPVGALLVFPHHMSTQTALHFVNTPTCQRRQFGKSSSNTATVPLTLALLECPVFNRHLRILDTRCGNLEVCTLKN